VDWALGNSNRRVRKGYSSGSDIYAATNPPNRYMRMTYNDVIEPTGIGQIITNTYNITVEVCYVYQDLGHDRHLGRARQRMIQQQSCRRRKGSLVRSPQEYRSGLRKGLYV